MTQSPKVTNSFLTIPIQSEVDIEQIVFKIRENAQKGI